jgi:hypothetical protein
MKKKGKNAFSGEAKTSSKKRNKLKQFFKEK